jgi:CO/xanthine dehydrogenase FAD-binding subunit
VALPVSLDEAVSVADARPDATLIAGGTDLMPRINAGRLLPSSLLCLAGVPDLRAVWPSEDEIVLGAGLTFAELMDRQVAALLPALAQAARTLGTPQVRGQATIGGNLATGAPDGDALPVLVALGAEVVCRSVRGWRQVPVLDLYDRAGGARLEPGELITSVRVPVTGGMQSFLKITSSGGAGRAVVSVSLVIDLERRTVSCALGNTAPVVQRCDHAGHWLAAQVDWEASAIPDPRTYETFARLVAESAADRPAGQGGAHGTWWADADYQRRAVEVCARRALVRALPPVGWLEQVRRYQGQAEFQRNMRRVLGPDAASPTPLEPAPPLPPAGARMPARTDGVG